MREMFVLTEMSGEVKIRVGQCTQQTVEVCPLQGATHLAVCHTAGYWAPSVAYYSSVLYGRKWTILC